MRGNTYKKATIYSATNTVRRFFKNRPGADSITVDEIYEAVGRNLPEYKKRNEGWLSNRLTGVYSHGLVEPVYSFNPWRKLERLELTDKGKIALGRNEASSGTEESKTSDKAILGTKDLTIDDIIKAAERINKEFSTYKVRVILEEVKDDS